MSGDQRLVEVFVELADTLVDDFDVVDLLQVLTERCVELVDTDAAGLMLDDQRGTLQVVASTSESARLLELFELQRDEGPCLECFRTGQVIANIDLTEAGSRWPRFAEAARGVGFAVSHAVPLRLRQQVIGALNLFTVEQRRLSDEHLAVARGLADIATIGLLHERAIRDQVVLSEQLQAALHSRILIEQAKGVLSARAATSVDEAFRLMRTHARRTGRPLTAVADAVVAGTLGAGELSDGRPAPSRQRR
ncbi:GAF and ANTAR domain-containing protein [Geodermatophilus sabuli]|uniref:GAF domain-containing protein n=1 Tax=Geodermatophilus sabuli TaxID=1564158 RepID=A0A285EKM7_9ACTN|nr:GAF and ANTAR domain-containing protein [Geodermatophilus sabuli]MBB3083902.1 transcriptional regulator with GAF, ATPase, and Fis domain [Geodermatophilus sabuli]SNX98551.1 GAF domain-containing protein [Geodermatophilus sabuli]